MSETNRRDDSNVRPAIELLGELAHAMRVQLVDREWYKVLSGQTEPYIDHRDAEFHLRALYRILGANVQVQP